MAGRKYFTFSGTSSATWDLFITGQGTYNSAEREYTFHEIPGRSGDLLAPYGRWRNQTIMYPAFIAKNFDTNYKAMRAFLASHVGYFRLTDDYNAGEYRMAAFTGTIEPNISQYYHSGSFTIQFTCKPQRWLTTGETATEFSANGTITNPTLFDASPMIRVYGAGQIGVASATITIASHSYSYIDIDCDTMNATYNTNNANQYITVANHQFPVLKPGSNGVTIGTGITKIQITPRWYTL